MDAQFCETPNCGDAPSTGGGSNDTPFNPNPTIDTGQGGSNGAGPGDHTIFRQATRAELEEAEAASRRGEATTDQKELLRLHDLGLVNISSPGDGGGGGADDTPFNPDPTIDTGEGGPNGAGPGDHTIG